MTDSGSRPTKSGLAPALGAALVLGLAACSEGCTHELPVSDPLAESQRMTLEHVNDLLWPRAEDNWQPLSEGQLLGLEKLITLLLHRAEAGDMSAVDLRRAHTYAALVGVELRTIELELDGRSERFWALTEPADDRRGRGSYLIRVGSLSPPAGERRPRRVEHLLQAPHSRFDKYSGKIALTLFLEREVGVQPPRALFVNTVHRHRQVDGSRVRRADNPADAAHQFDHPIARATAAALRKHPLVLVQLHGFERIAESGDPDVIVSSGIESPRPASAGVLRRLRVALPEFPMGHYGVDTDRLGALSNVQGQAARDARRCFVHIETSESVRQALRTDRGARRRFSAAVFGGDAGEFRGGCK
ncbi:hypothetical protein ENSA5_40760 [Enhygromyxa salina]|uniref:Uncharacterized protein n=1 Tax=Enhygromyxa salina TaxID=215803 RepID=A0A2S9XNK9_9BACT|nr:hypothetical protein [Enhygromyxa salina]PRP94457.1 hypothetical protein ENSA5_40760 [Enhygromyxa salina]